MKIEFVYNKKADKTVIYIWKGMQLVDVRDLNGQITSEHENKLTQSIKEESKWIKENLT